MKLVNTSTIDIVQYLYNRFGGDLISEYGTTTLIFNNEHGYGEIKAYESYSGISSILFNIRLNKDLIMERSEFSFNPVYCSYCLKGHIFQKFQGDEDFEQLSTHQSFILAGNKRKMDITGFPADKDLQVVMIFLLQQKGGEKKFPIRNDFRGYVNRIKTKTPFMELNEMTPRTAQYAKKLLENDETGIVGRLYNESAIMGILASQLQSFEQTLDNEEKSLKVNEIARILKLANFIELNLDRKYTIPLLYEISGMHPKKLQIGFKQLFGATVNTFILTARLEKARELIETTDLNISQVVYSLGINSRSYFSKAFTNRFGVSPSEYQNLENIDRQVFELSYTSNPVDSISDKDVEEIIRVSRRKNKDLNITGCLVYDRNNFLQILEGRKSRVLEVFEDIKQDERHEDIKVTWQGLRRARKFKQWSMALIHVNENENTSIENADIELDYLLTSELNRINDSAGFWDKIKEEL